MRVRTYIKKGKYKQIREILEPLPDRRFDPSIVRVPYVSGFGTAYVDAYEQVNCAAQQKPMYTTERSLIMLLLYRYARHVRF